MRLRRCTAWRCTSCSSFTHCSQPVSYTHLDVYKRQLLYCCYYSFYLLLFVSNRWRSIATDNDITARFLDGSMNVLTPVVLASDKFYTQLLRLNHLLGFVGYFLTPKHRIHSHQFPLFYFAADIFVTTSAADMF